VTENGKVRVSKWGGNAKTSKIQEKRGFLNGKGGEGKIKNQNHGKMRELGVKKRRKNIKNKKE
jgi:hypothetical protein